MGPDAKAAPEKSLRKRTKSTVSLRSLGRKKEKDKDKEKEKDKAEDSNDRARDHRPDAVEMKATAKKTKSTANLAAMFGKSRPKESKEGKDGKDGKSATPTGDRKSVV